MKKNYIDPGKIMVPGQLNVPRPDLLRGYYHALQSRRENRLPRVILMATSDVLCYMRTDYYESLDDLSEASKTLAAENQYCLLDGTHRSIATELLERKVKAYVITSGEDLRDLQRSGTRLPGNVQKAESIGDLTRRWSANAGLRGRDPTAWNVRQGVHDLIEAGEIPFDMALNYGWTRPSAEKMKLRIQVYCRQDDPNPDNQSAISDSYWANIRPDTTVEILCKQLSIRPLQRRRSIRHGSKSEHVFRGKICEDDIFVVDLQKNKVSELISPLLVED